MGMAVMNFMPQLCDLALFEPMGDHSLKQVLLSLSPSLSLSLSLSEPMGDHSLKQVRVPLSP
jgi:hypothetical protein